MRLKLTQLNHASGGTMVGILIVVVVSMVILSAAISWTFNTSRLTHRHNQYNRCLAAAEAATEKAIVTLNHDYKTYGQAYVERNIDKYRRTVPDQKEYSGWAEFKFRDLQGRGNHIEMDFSPATNFTVVSPQYRSLKGFPYKFKVTAVAEEVNSPMKVSGGVQQEVVLSLIPVFQFAQFYNVDYECSALPRMVVSGPVHCNGDIYLSPVTGLTYNNDVTCTGKIYRKPKPGCPIPPQGGPVAFYGASDGGAPLLSLPIGTNNSLTAVRQVVEIPLPMESPYSNIGQQRIYNKADMIIDVTDVGLRVTSGLWNGFITVVPNTEATNFIKTSVTFYNAREKKNVKCTEIDIAALRQWNATNTWLRSWLPLRDVRVIYVADRRTQTSSGSGSGTQPGIRLINGETLLPLGLTIASPHPVYVKGNYNCPNPSHRGTTNTTQTVPAAIMADAITLLSVNWSDAKSSGNLSDRIAGDTTVNAAFLAGVVQTTSSSYSGGVENFPRFLEEWSNKTLTYNGSMVMMFESRYATAPWVNINIYYNPPIRNWAFDRNFQEVWGLPPATPCAYALLRGRWNAVPSYALAAN